MSLVAFHRLLIATAILFCGGFAAWQVDRFLRAGGPLHAVLAGAFALGAVGLLYYLLRLKRFLGRESGS